MAAGGGSRCCVAIADTLLLIAVAVDTPQTAVAYHAVTVDSHLTVVVADNPPSAVVHTPGSVVAAYTPEMAAVVDTPGMVAAVRTPEMVADTASVVIARIPSASIAGAAADIQSRLHTQVLKPDTLGVTVSYRGRTVDYCQRHSHR